MNSAKQWFHTPDRHSPPFVLPCLCIHLSDELLAPLLYLILRNYHRTVDGAVDRCGGSLCGLRIPPKISASILSRSLPQASSRTSSSRPPKAIAPVSLTLAIYVIWQAQRRGPGDKNSRSRWAQTSSKQKLRVTTIAVACAAALLIIEFEP